MSNEKYYTYYKKDGKADKEFYSANFNREAVLTKMLKDSGAVAFTQSSSWGNNIPLVQELVYPRDHDYGFDKSKMKIISRDYYDGKPVIIARAKANSAEGREFNKKLYAPVNEANKLLKDIPTFENWFIKKYDIAYQSVGESTGQGMRLTMTRVGYVGDIILIKIPLKERDSSGEPPTVPESFEQITYGQFYDLGNQE